MNHFLGFFIDDQTRRQAIKRVNRVSTIFADMGIQVRWVKPSCYYIKVQNLPGYIGLLKRLHISYKLKNIFKKSVRLSIGNIKLGSNRNLKGLVYLEIERGGDMLRDLKYQITRKLKIKDNVQFIPHIALGRINKDLSRQEYSNISKDVRNISKDFKKEEILFSLEELDLVRIKNRNYEILKKFDISQ